MTHQGTGTQGDDVHPEKMLAKALPVIKLNTFGKRRGRKGKGRGNKGNERIEDFSKVRIETS